jgi:long-chain fatty acid transport protein
MKRFTTRRLVIGMYATGFLALSSHAFAAGFQLFEQDGASIGSYHAGYAALAKDASIAFYNPAGITRIKNQQLVFAGNTIATDFQYKGTIGVNTILGGIPRSVTAQGGNVAFVPALHYVAPLTDNLGFGFSVDIPFGLKTNYGQSTILRYAATQTSVMVVDVSPSFGYQVTEKGSLGLGLDVQRMFAQFDQVGAAGPVETDTLSSNKVNDTGYGYHFGGLYQFTQDYRVGLSYHSKVVHHLTGTSQFTGPIANLLNEGPYQSHATTNITLPPYTALSAYGKMNPYYALMASAIYTQWSVEREIILNGISGVVSPFDMSTTIQASLPQYYRNTWNLSVGGEYFVSDKMTLRGALGYDETPVSNRYRNVTLPDNNRYVFAVGGHFQATKTIGLDLGWTHLMIAKTHINPPPMVTGAQVATTNGDATGGADVYGAQVTWDLV